MELSTPLWLASLYLYSLENLVVVNENPMPNIWAIIFNSEEALWPWRVMWMAGWALITPYSGMWWLAMGLVTVTTTMKISFITSSLAVRCSSKGPATRLTGFRHSDNEDLIKLSASRSVVDTGVGLKMWVTPSHEENKLTKIKRDSFVSCLFLWRRIFWWNIDKGYPNDKNKDINELRC